MDNRLFVLVLQEAESDERTSSHSLRSVLWDVFEMHSNSRPSLGNVSQLASMNLRKIDPPIPCRLRLRLVYEPLAPSS
jgi:hypothetical protein